MSKCDLDLTVQLAVEAGAEKMLSKLYWETVRCSKLILGRGIGWWVVGVQRHGMAMVLAFDFFAVTLIY